MKDFLNKKCTLDFESLVWEKECKLSLVILIMILITCYNVNI